jgi:hypothetical protein
MRIHTKMSWIRNTGYRPFTCHQSELRKRRGPLTKSEDAALCSIGLLTMSACIRIRILPFKPGQLNNWQDFTSILKIFGGKYVPYVITN